MMSYFYDCSNEKQAKEKYRRLSKELHPDKGGSHEKMINLQQQYDKFLKEIASSNKEYNYFDEEYENYESYNFGYKRYEPKHRSPSNEYEQEEIKKLNITISFLNNKIRNNEILHKIQQQEIFDLRQKINSLTVINKEFQPILDGKDKKIKELEKKVKTYKNFNLYLSGVLVFISILKLIF